MNKTGDRSPEWGSDSFAAVLDKLNLEYIALNPGASYRGLHDSLVNFTSGCRMLLCIHEETAVSIAQGWAKVTGRAMGVALHSNVGLLHASMSIYNAWCDRMPMLIIGATGPVDAMKRRPWIDWVHTSQDQGALIREFVKWDDQPGSVGAACQALAEGAARAQTAPCGPVYVNLDSALQEQKLSTPIAQPDFARLKRLRRPCPTRLWCERPR
jgi:acetolactate synthase I/II/III large subunit